MQITLSKTDREFARHHGLSRGEMRDFIEDQNREEEMMKTHYEKENQERKDCKNSPQAFYAAW